MTLDIKILILFICTSCIAIKGSAQEIIPISQHFDKIIVSPHIQLTLEQGETERITINKHEVPIDKINVKVEGKVLHIYLEGAKMTTKKEKKEHAPSSPIYRGTQVVAHIHYEILKDLSIRGEETSTLISPIVEDKFTVHLYGESKLLIDSIRTKELKAMLYGDNHLSIHAGEALSQVYKSYGASKVDATFLYSDFSKITSYGESTFNLHSNKKIKIWAFGDASINYSGSPEIQRLITIGEIKLNKLD